MRWMPVVLGFAFCLAACGRHPNGRYDAVPVPSSISHRINAHGVRAARVADGSQQRWFLMHADGSRDAVSGLPDGAQVTGINDKEELTGYVETPGCTGSHCTARAFVWSAGNLRDLGTLAGSSVRPEAINNKGDIAGTIEVASDHPAQCSSSTAHSEMHPFVYANGKTSDLGAPPGSCGMVLRLNDNDDALIVYTHQNDAGHQVDLSAGYRGGKVIALPGNGTLTAYELDASGQFVGSLATADGNYHAVVVRADGTVQDLGTGGYCCSDALGINDQGAIVGYVDTGSASNDASRHNLLHAVIFRDSKIVDLNGLVDWSDAGRGRNLVVGMADFVGEDGEILCQVYDAHGKFIGMYVLRPQMR